MLSKTKEYAAAYWRKWKQANRPDVQKVCSVCGKHFKQTSNVQKRCVECHIRNCVYCGNAFRLTCGKKAQSCCSRKCAAKNDSARAIRINKNRGVKPRTALKRHRDKHGCVEDREWRMDVFKRDNFTCQLCGVRGGRLQADHIKPFSTHPKLRHRLSNGRTVCVSCHKLTPTYGYKARQFKPRKQEVFNFDARAEASQRASGRWQSR